MCANYTEMNKAYLKDNYSLPRIDQLLDANVGHKLLTFMPSQDTTRLWGPSRTKSIISLSPTKEYTNIESCRLD